MLPCLDRKLFRDLNRLCGQAMAVALVMACGLAMMIMARSLIRSLETARDDYYQDHRFAQVFAHLKQRVPSPTRQPGFRVSPAHRRTSPSRSPLTLPAWMNRPAAQSVRFRHRPAWLNRLFLRAGRWLTRDAMARSLSAKRSPRPTGFVRAIRSLWCFMADARSCASPASSSRPSSSSNPSWHPSARQPRLRQLLAPVRRFGGRFQPRWRLQLHRLSLSNRARPNALSLPSLDRLFKPYGGRGAFGRAASVAYPCPGRNPGAGHDGGRLIVFLGVAAFMTNAILSPLVDLQRADCHSQGLRLHQSTGRRPLFQVRARDRHGGTLTGAIGGALLGQWLVVPQDFPVPRTDVPSGPSGSARCVDRERRCGDERACLVPCGARHACLPRRPCVPNRPPRTVPPGSSAARWHGISPRPSASRCAISSVVSCGRCSHARACLGHRHTHCANCFEERQWPRSSITNGT